MPHFTGDFAAPSATPTELANSPWLAELQPARPESGTAPGKDRTLASNIESAQLKEVSWPDTSGDKHIQWQTDLKKAFQQAQDEHKPIICEIGASWCGYCKVMNDNVVSDPAFAEQFADKAIFVRLDAESDEAGKAIAAGFKVNEYPTFLVFDTSKGSLAESGRTVGYLDLDKFSVAVNQYLPQEPHSQGIQLVMPMRHATPPVLI